MVTPSLARSGGILSRPNEIPDTIQVRRLDQVVDFFAGCGFPGHTNCGALSMVYGAPMHLFVDSGMDSWKIGLYQLKHPRDSNWK